MLKLNLSRLALGAGLAFAAASSVAANYQLTRVDVAGAQWVALTDINNRNWAVGNYVMSDADYGHAFIYANGATQLLSGPSGAIGSTASGISDSGAVVGSFTTGSSTDPEGGVIFDSIQGFIYAGGQYQVVNVAGANDTFLRGISPDGRYVSGYAQFANRSRGFALDLVGGGLTLLGPSNGYTVAQGINANGVIVGDAREFTGPGTSTSTRTSFSYDLATGQSTDANIAGVARTAFRDISVDGTIAGFYTDTLGTHGFMGSTTSYQAFDFGSSDLTILEGINDARWLVGSANDANGQGFGVLLAPVPEPATWILIAAGGALLGIRRRR